MFLHNIHPFSPSLEYSKNIPFGASGKVYKGELTLFKKSIPVAVKRLDHRAYFYGKGAFLKEVAKLSRYVHKNIITLRGFCEEGNEKIIIIDHAINGRKIAIEKAEKYSDPTLLKIIDAGDGVKDVFLSWMVARCFEEKKLHALILGDIMKQTDAKSIEIRSKVAYKCLKKDQEKRPMMALVIQELEKALNIYNFHDTVPAFPVKAVDTTSAGDSFVGALLTKIVDDQSVLHDEAKLKNIMRYSCACEAITTTKKGAIPSLPSVAEVHTFMDAQHSFIFT
ncbi:phloem protein 2-like protein [Tanacetum coccineum]